MQFWKIYFQAGAIGGVTGFGDLLKSCDGAGVPVYGAASSSMNTLYDLQVARNKSSVLHKGNFIPTLDAQNKRFDLDYTVYPSADAAHAAWREFAASRWQKAVQVIPPELDPAITTVSLENEQRPYVGWCQKDHPTPSDPECQQRIERFTGWADCIGWQAYYSGLEALRLGYRYMAFGFAGGNPEEGVWEQPGMLEYLRLCAANPDKLGVALHEYSFSDTLRDGWGNKIGRFMQLHAACDKHGIRRPSIDIKEFGWRQDTIPAWSESVLTELHEAANLYARYTNIRGAAIWTTQVGWGNCRDRALAMVQHIIDAALDYRYMGVVENPDDITPPATGVTPPDQTITHTIHLLPQDTTLTELQQTTDKLHPTRSAFTYSADVAHAVMYAGNPQSKVVIWDADRWQDDITAWFNARGIKNLEYRQFDKSSADINLVYRPCATDRVTQYFGVNPQNYPCCPGHDGIDYGVERGKPFYAAAGGVVVHASDRKPNSSDPSAYGWHIYVDHGGYHTLYAHAQYPLPVTVGQRVAAGQIVGYSGNTGYSTGYHLHFGLLVPYDSGNGYPMWTYGQAIDPYPYVSGLPAPNEKPVEGSALIGLHASADPGRFYGGTAEFVEFKTLAGAAVTAVKVLNAHDPNDIERVYQDARSAGNPVGLWVVRAFLRFDGRQVSPAEFVQWTKDDTQRTIERLTGLGVQRGNILIELHNEPNLQIEGAGVSWRDGNGFDQWLKAVLSQYRSLFPNCKMVYPALSPGTAVAGVRLDDKEFFEQSASAASLCDYVGVHCYWQNNHAVYPMSAALEHLDWYINTGRKVVVTEASNNRRDYPPATGVYVEDYYKFWLECRKRPAVTAVTYFVASASDPTFQAECWVVNGQSKGIAAGLAALI